MSRNGFGRSGRRNDKPDQAVAMVYQGMELRQRHERASFTQQAVPLVPSTYTSPPRTSPGMPLQKRKLSSRGSVRPPPTAMSAKTHSGMIYDDPRYVGPGVTESLLEQTLGSSSRLMKARTDQLFSNHQNFQTMQRRTSLPTDESGRAQSSPDQARYDPLLSSAHTPPGHRHGQVPPLSAPAKVLSKEHPIPKGIQEESIFNEARELSEAGEDFKRLRELFATCEEVLPIHVTSEESVEKFNVSMTIHSIDAPDVPDTKLLRLTEKQTAKKMLERSDVHELAEVLDKCLSGIWAKGEDSGQIEKARQAIEIAMNELSKQVSVHCADRGMLLQETFDKYRGLKGKENEKLAEMEEQADDAEEQKRNMQEVMDYMKADHKLLMSEVQLYDDALHTMVADIISLQNDVTTAEKRAERTELQLENMRRSHVDLINKQGTLKLRCALKERMRRKATLRMKEIESKFEEIEVRAVEAELKLADSKTVIKDMSADASFKDKMYQEHLDELSEELDNSNTEITRLKDVVIVDLEQQNGELERKIKKLQRQLEAEKAKPKGMRLPAPVAAPATQEKKEEVVEESEESDSDEEEDRVMVGIEMLREAQDEVVGLQVSLVQTQEQLERAVMELDRAILAFERSETKLDEAHATQLTLTQNNAMLIMQVQKLEELATFAQSEVLRVEEDARKGVKPKPPPKRSAAAEKEAKLAREAEARAQALEVKLKEADAAMGKVAQEQEAAAEKRAEAEKAMMEATSDEQRQAAAQMMLEVQNAEQAVAAALAKAEHDAKLIREAAEAEAQAARERGEAAAAAKVKREAEEARAAMQCRLEEAERLGDDTAALEELKGQLAAAEREAGEAAKKQATLDAKMQKDAMERLQKAENEAAELKAAAETAMASATSEAERMAAQRQLEAAQAKQELAQAASQRLQEVEAAVETRSEPDAPDASPTGNMFWRVKALSTMGLFAREVGNLGEALEKRNALLGLNREEEKQLDDMLDKASQDILKAREEIDDVPTEVGPNPAARKLQMRTKLVSLQQNTLTLLKPGADGSQKSGLLWTPNSMSITESMALQNKLEKDEQPLEGGSALVDALREELLAAQAQIEEMQGTIEALRSDVHNLKKQLEDAAAARQAGMLDGDGPTTMEEAAELIQQLRQEVKHQNIQMKESNEREERIIKEKEAVITRKAGAAFKSNVEKKEKEKQAKTAAASGRKKLKKVKAAVAGGLAFKAAVDDSDDEDSSAASAPPTARPWPYGPDGYVCQNCGHCNRSKCGDCHRDPKWGLGHDNIYGFLCDECQYRSQNPKRALPEDFAAEFRRKNPPVMEAQELKDATEDMAKDMPSKETPAERAGREMVEMMKKKKQQRNAAEHKKEAATSGRNKMKRAVNSKEMKKTTNARSFAEELAEMQAATEEKTEKLRQEREKERQEQEELKEQGRVQRVRKTWNKAGVAITTGVRLTAAGEEHRQKEAEAEAQRILEMEEQTRVELMKELSPYTCCTNRRCLLCILSSFVEASPEGVLDALEVGFDKAGCECGGKMPSLVLELITGPLLQLALQLTGQSLQERGARNNGGISAGFYNARPDSPQSPLPDLEAAKVERKLADRKESENFAGAVDQSGVWDQYSGLTEDQLVEAPKLPSKKPKKVVIKSCKFHCCPNDGHTTHCFVYNDYEGIRGGVLTCMFSNDRLPIGFQEPEEDTTPDGDVLSPVGDKGGIKGSTELQGDEDPALDLAAARKRLAVANLELAQLKTELETVKAELFVEKGSPPRRESPTLSQKQFDAARKVVAEHRGDRDRWQASTVDYVSSLGRSSIMHGRSPPRDRPVAVSRQLGQR